jgi:hypothetical protein
MALTAARKCPGGSGFLNALSILRRLNGYCDQHYHWI